MQGKTIVTLALALGLVLALGGAAAAKKDAAATIQSGDIYYSSGHYLAGQSLSTGYDIFGYNYQAHLFNGSYANAYLGAAGYAPYEGDDASYLAENPGADSHWAWAYRDIKLNMKWNDAWMANTDANRDGALDRHWGYDSYIGSGAWETNHMQGANPDGSTWSSFTKIVAAPADAYQEGGYWYTADGKEMGQVIWGQFAIVQDVLNGVIYKGDRPGFGNW